MSEASHTPQAQKPALSSPIGGFVQAQPPTGREAQPAGSGAREKDILSVAKGGGVTFIGSLIEFGVRFVIGVLLARFLGPEQFGLYTLAMTIITVAAGAALLGLPSALVRYIPLFANRQDNAGIWGTIQVGIGLTTALSVLTAAGLFFGAGPIAAGLFREPTLVPLLRWFSFFVPLLVLIDTLSAATRGFNRMEYTVISKSVSQPIIKLSLVVILAFVGLNAAKALAAHFVSVTISFGVILYLLHRLFPLKRSLRAARREVKEMVRFSLPLHMDYLIVTFRGNIQTVLLGALNTLATVGIFTVATQVNLIGQMFHQSIVTASMPIVSELYGGANADLGRGPLARFYQTMTKWTFSLNLPLFLVALLFPSPILAFFGEDFRSGALALTLLAVGNLVNTGTGICGVIINMSGNTIFNLFNSVVLLTVTLGLNFWLIPKWGLVGAAMATMVAMVGVNLLRLIEVYGLFRMLPYNRSFIKPVTAGLVTLGLIWALRELFHLDAHLLGALVGIVSLLAVYLGMLLLLGLSEEDRLVLARIGRRVTAVLAK